MKKYYVTVKYSGEINEYVEAKDLEHADLKAVEIIDTQAPSGCDDVNFQVEEITEN
ncbi:TPA: hypothetical protein ACU27A_002643 [Staphylococcus aureus]|uniref:hypothetical protein n=1 Tax=Staphylococcus aureus TaxID=1280 RepID=UPI0015E1A91A|nr:hypothetical protein [Staphylococcus aureus]CAG9976385.1 hypothetical protein SA3102_SA3102_00685 [Staphylococcus aureus]CAH0008673.1 hypothetical protein SA3056_SA3056_00034 [Staphylococcus aureus]HDL4506843.1 hypothetical protein [Staphylococcus aureus]